MTMPGHIQRAIRALVAATALVPHCIHGEDVPAASPQPHVAHAPHWQAATAAAYGQIHASPNGHAPPGMPAVPVHSPTANIAHDPSHQPHDTHGSAIPSIHKQYPLWEQSSGAQELTSHSWQPPLAQENLGHWDVAMSTIPSEEHVLLIPGDANRTGQFWHRQAIPAREFEVQFGFGVFGKDQGVQEAAGGVANGVGISDGFAFWYVYEPYASVYPRTPEEQASWNLIGYKSTPKGFGVIFKTLDREGHLNPSISCIHNTEDGRSVAEEIPGPSAFFYQYRNQPTPVLFRVIIGNQGVVAQIRESPTTGWITACSLNHVILHPHGFIGFTGHNRPAVDQEQQASGQDQQQSHANQSGDQVLLYFVKLWSLDSAAAGQSDQLSQHHSLPPHGGHLPTAAHPQQSHEEHYGGIPNAVHHAYADAHYAYSDPTIVRMLTSIGNQLSMLSVEVSNLRHDVRKLWGEEGSDAVKSIKSELTGFKDLFKRHSQQHTSALHTIHKQVENKSSASGHSPILSQLSDLSNQLEKGIAVKQTHSFIFSATALVLVVLFVLFSWRKLQDIEKKHML